MNVQKMIVPLLVLIFVFGCYLVLTNISFAKPEPVTEDVTPIVVTLKSKGGVQSAILLTAEQDPKKRFMLIATPTPELRASIDKMEEGEKVTFFVRTEDLQKGVVPLWGVTRADGTVLVDPNTEEKRAQRHRYFNPPPVNTIPMEAFFFIDLPPLYGLCLFLSGAFRRKEGLNSL